MITVLKVLGIIFACCFILGIILMIVLYFEEKRWSRDD